MAAERSRRPPAVARVLERVTSTAREHAMFSPGDLVLVSVSGGPDSVCLLQSLWRLRRLFRIELAVFHFDHRLRATSAEDAAYVDRIAHRLGIASHLVTAVSRPPRGGSVEAWAHGARTRARATVAHDIGARRIATGHTLDDHAETVLMALLEGAGIEGVSGLAPIAGEVVRPMLDVTRDDVESFCRSLGLRPRRDPTNLDRRFLRNAVRLRGLPALERVVGRGVREPIARSGTLLRADALELARQADRAWPEVATMTADGIDMSVAGLRALPDVIAARVAARAIHLSGTSATRVHVRAVLDLAVGRPGREVALGGGSTARRGRGYVRIGRASPQEIDANGGVRGTSGGELA